MIKIWTNGEALDLPRNFSIEIEETNPIFNDRGSQSVPALVPATRKNRLLLDFPDRIDGAIDPNAPMRSAIVEDGCYRRKGAVNVTEAGAKDGITFNIGFDNSTAYAAWQNRKLSELSNLPVYIPPTSIAGSAVDRLIQALDQVYSGDSAADFAVFPVAVNNECLESDGGKTVYWEILNVSGEDGLKQPAKVKRLIDGEVTEVNVPKGYMVTPFLYVWKVIDLIFADMGLILKSDPFERDTELARLVVLNNAADSCCRGEIRYSDLMPDCTVEEFLNALWVRFGLVYNINFDEMSVDMRLLSSILDSNADADLKDWSAPGKIIYEQPQYLKLSSKHSIEGAAPSHERFEDFSKGLDVSMMRLAAAVGNWRNTGTANNPKWDGDLRDDYPEDEAPDPDDPDYPDPDYPDYEDDYDFESYSANALVSPMAAADSTSTTATELTGDNSILAREFVTGTFYRLDANNGKVRASSSPFFDWDPQSEGLSALELSSEDECVPMARVYNVGTGTGHTFNGVAPAYLCGARHYHSYIKGSDEADKSGDSTPLAFMFAYTVDAKTIGRLSPEGADGKRMTLDDGTKPTLSLLFQFKDGLFARFWTRYDEILRHGNRSVELSGIFNKVDLRKLDLLKPVTFKNIRCLVDTATYSLPSGKEVVADLKLRTIQTQGSYDIKAEQNIPEIATANRHLEWRLKSETFGVSLDTNAAKLAAVNKYKTFSNYQSHGVNGDYYRLGTEGASLKSVVRTAMIWQNDEFLSAPTAHGQRLTRTYKALLYYDIYEVHETSEDDGTGENIEWELSDDPLGVTSLEVDYQVVLTARWVND